MWFRKVKAGYYRAHHGCRLYEIRKGFKKLWWLYINGERENSCPPLTAAKKMAQQELALVKDHLTEYRVAEKSDAYAITRLIRQSFTIAQLSTAFIRDVDEMVGQKQIYIAKEGRTLVAAVAVDDQTWGHLHLDVVCVRPRRQRQGVGTNILNYVEYEAINRIDCDRLTLITEPDLAPFYAKCGFVHTRTTGEDTCGVPIWTMEKELL